MTRKFPSCSGTAIPIVRLAFEKKSCARTGGTRISNPDEIATFVKATFGCRPQEHFLVLYVSQRFELLGVHEVSLGAIDSVGVDPRIVFAGALLSGAIGIFLVHNHPSLVPEPSQADHDLTKRIFDAGKLLGIKVMDHLIVGGGRHYSFVANGQMPIG